MRKKRKKRKKPPTNGHIHPHNKLPHRVLTKGFVLLWSNTLNDLVAFYKTEVDREKIPPGFVPYSDKELWELFGKNLPPGRHTLRLIHEAKKLSWHVVDNESC
jgi:hypothetical protein